MMLFFLYLGIIIFFLIFILLTLSFHIGVIKLNIDSSEKKILNDFEFIFKVYILNIIPIINIRINERKIKQFQKSKMLERLSNIDYKKISRNIEKKIYREFKITDLIRFSTYMLKKLKPEILLFRLYLELGFNDIFLTVYSIPIISTIITALLKYGNIDKNLKKNKNKYKYEIIPVYNKYKINLKSDCIISIKFVHIIIILYNFLILQRRSDINGRTSYRRSYGYSHE